MNIKKYSTIQYFLISLCANYIKSITQDIQIKKLPYLTINENNEDVPLRKL